MNDEKIIFSKLRAFYLFTTEGIEEVERVYPDCVSFVQKHKQKTYEQIEQELMADSLSS